MSQQADFDYFERHLGRARLIPSHYRLGIGAQHLRVGWRNYLKFHE